MKPSFKPPLVPRGTPRPPDGAPIFLTGATGFLGGYLLRELLRQTRSQVVCLVRAASKDAGLDRVRKNLGRTGPLESEIQERVSVVVGDLNQLCFGLEQAQFETLAAELGAIVHCGAVINWSDSYDALSGANVGGTREVIRLSCFAGGLPVHHVSSTEVYPFGDVTRDLFAEQDDLEHCERLRIPYFQTKWVSERMLENARDRGVPVAIYRPGLIGGDSLTGVEFGCENHFFYGFLSGCLKLKEAPRIEKVIDLVPVDWVARALVTLLRDSRTLGRKFNFINPQPMRQQELYAALRALGYPLIEIAYPRWREKILELSAEDNNPLERFKLYYREMTDVRMARIEAQMAQRMPLEDANTRALLEGKDVECPAFDEKLLGIYIDCYAHRGLLPPPPSKDTVNAVVETPAPPRMEEESLLLKDLVGSDRRLIKLYEKGKERQWNATRRIDWSLDLDPENPQDLPDTAIPIYGSDLFRKLNRQEKAHLRHHYQAWQLSQFMHGEQGALACAAKIVQKCPTVEGRLYAATQTIDEARHLEIFSRLLHEKFELSFPVVAPLERLLKDTLSDSRWDMTCLGMQVLVEGLALAAFALTRDHSKNPLAASINAYVMEDEARHVAFGRLSLVDYYRELSAPELAEREEFVVEASYLLRDRFQATDVWDSLGLPTAACAAWMRESGFQRNWQKQLFSRIVPSVHAIGLFGPKVKKAYAQMGVLSLSEVDLDAVQEEDEQIALDMQKGAVLS
ncbi:MAG: thioester reductase domain-containing protein [Terriglobia bacterium]